MDSTYAEIGTKVIILKSSACTRDSGWSPYMDQYIGYSACITRVHDDTPPGPLGARWCKLDIDNGNWWWPVSSLILESDRKLLKDVSVLKGQMLL